jgi:site-specific recombinase XerD
MPDTSVVEAVRVVGPLAPYAPRFADELRRRGYTECSTAGQLRLMAHASRWLANQGLDAAGFTPQRLAAFSADRMAAGYQGLRTVRALRPLEEFLQAAGALPVPIAPKPQSPTEHLLARYRGFLEGERGVVETVSAQWLRVAARFLAEHPGLAEGTAAIGAAEVSAFCVRELPSRSASAAQNLAASLRSFLRFCHIEGLVDAPLAQAVPPVARRVRTGVPRGISADARCRLLASCDRESSRGRRDYAVLLLLTRLGLRAGEVARLGLDDVDWHLGEIVVHGKGNRVEKMPLPVDVGEAVAVYLSKGRPRAESRAVFLRAIAPWTALSAGGVTWIVYDACRRAGVERVGAHCLRHSAASDMLAAGASFGEIGQLLRHAAVSSTGIYAKVDFTALRPLSQPWPGGAA